MWGTDYPCSQTTLTCPIFAIITTDLSDEDASLNRYKHTKGINGGATSPLEDHHRSRASRGHSLPTDTEEFGATYQLHRIGLAIPC